MKPLRAAPTDALPSVRSTAPLALSLAALGIVFGDLGTSPLYALQEAFHGQRGVAPTADNVIGCLSLFIWSLIVMVSLKYVFVLMRADNHGEGGILALLALLVPNVARPSGTAAAPRTPGRAVWVGIALIGTAMLYGDGVITPAISVLSAVEGLSVATSAFDPYLVPLTVVILVALFAIQALGSGKVGAAFGPILAVWFVVILALGIASLVQTPRALEAFNPLTGAAFFRRNGFRGFVALGAVVLCLTGGEALYADMGHFGRRPIRLAWYGLALPALLCNYLGQGALLLRDPALADRPFYAMVPSWGLYPMVVLATLATIVASQALISAVFSLTYQAMQMGLWPRVRFVNTSAATRGQIYLPTMNWVLMIATVAVVLGFRSSSSLAAAFGLAVSTTMAMTTLLFAALARTRWQWSVGRTLAFAGVFLVIDLAFVGANALKFAEGGWLPVLLGAVVFLLMLSWRYGRTQLEAARSGTGLTLRDLIASLRAASLQRVEGTAVFLAERSDDVPAVLLHHLKHNQVLHRRVALLTITTVDAPYAAPGDRLTWTLYDEGFMRIVARYGYMESPDVPALLGEVSGPGAEAFADPMRTSFFLGHETLTMQPSWRVLRGTLLRLFIWQRRNELDATAHFGIPANRVVEMGARRQFAAR